LLHCCSKRHRSKPTSTLRCGFVSNQSSQPLEQVMIFLQIFFLFQTKLPNTRMCSLSLSKPLSYSRLKFQTHNLQTPFLLQIENLNTHEKEEKTRRKRKRRAKRKKRKKRRRSKEKKEKMGRDKKVRWTRRKQTKEEEYLEKDKEKKNNNNKIEEEE